MLKKVYRVLCKSNLFNSIGQQLTVKAIIIIILSIANVFKN